MHDLSHDSSEQSNLYRLQIEHFSMFKSLSLSWLLQRQGRYAIANDFTFSTVFRNNR